MVNKTGGCDDASVPESAGSDERAVLERLALAEWSESASAEALSAKVVGDRAEVRLVVNGDYEYWQYFQRLGRSWRDAIGGNAPCAGWDDPDAIQWPDEADDDVDVR